MTPRPLGEVGFGPRSHLPALWWLGVLYRRPKAFRETLGRLAKGRQLRVGTALSLHALPWFFLFVAIGRVALTIGGRIAVPAETSALALLFLETVRKAAFGIAAGIAGAIAVGIAVGIAGGIAVGIVLLRAY